MEALDFFRSILPPRGWYYCAVVAPGEKARFKHHACESIEELAAKCYNFDKQGATVYFATSSYRDRSVQREKNGRTYFTQRTQDNVLAVRSFWLDLDVGDPNDGKHYGTQGEAVVALGTFVKETGLPKPMVVSSGYGIHAYWPLQTEVLPAQWKRTAENLKFLAAKLGMLTDPARTSDSASVLRPPGTFNRKNGTPRPVAALNVVEPISWSEFDGIVNRAMKTHKVVPPKVTAADVNQKVNAGAANIGATYPPSSGHIIADRCLQMGEIRDKKGDVEEPLWYAGLQLLHHTIEGDELAHEWSKGHPSYSREETAEKMKRVADFGPTMCATFEQRNPKGCEGCPFKQHVTTPMQLGVHLEQAAAPKVVIETDEGEIETEIPNPPAPFHRGMGEQQGLYVDVDGVPIRFYPYDLYPMGLEYDEAEDYETARIHHWLPMDGDKEFLLRSSLVHSPMDFNKAMADKQVKFKSDGKYKDVMRLYVSRYLEELQTRLPTKVHYKECGWKDNKTKFMLGHKMFTNDGHSYHAGMSKKSIGVSESLGVMGDYDKWKEALEILDRPGFEHMAFTFMIAFAAPLMELAEIGGPLMNMTGDTSKGKTTIARLMWSVYGNPNKGIASSDSTYLARIEKLAAYKHLPMYIDEITEMDVTTTSNLAYAVANGASRDRLKADAGMHETKTWKTLVLTSSNANIHDKLLLNENTSGEPQTYRVFEYLYPNIKGMDFDQLARDISHVVNHNHGHAGEIYISHLVQQDKEKIFEDIKRTAEHVAQYCESDGRERFWTYAVAAIIYGGMIAKDLDIISFDPLKVMPWVKKTIQYMREGMKNSKRTSLDYLAEFCDQKQSSRLVIGSQKMGALMVENVIKHPAQHAELTQRLELNTQRLYISVNAIREWLIKRGEDYKRTMEELEGEGVLLSRKVKKTLGKGSNYNAGRVNCWEVNAAKLNLEEDVSGG